MKAYKLEILVIDHEDMGEETIKVEIENTRYVYPKVQKIEVREIGEWSNDHPLNRMDTSKAEYERLFNS